VSVAALREGALSARRSACNRCTNARPPCRGLTGRSSIKLEHFLLFNHEYTALFAPGLNVPEALKLWPIAPKRRVSARP